MVGGIIMTREEIINNAAVKFATHFIDTGETDFYGHFVKELGLDDAEQRGFIHGAKWADENPKSPWISVEDDLPSNHEDMHNMSGSFLYTDNVLVLTGNRLLAGRRLVTYMIFNDNTGKWEWYTPLNVKYWMRIPESPK